MQTGGSCYQDDCIFCLDNLDASSPIVHIVWPDTVYASNDRDGNPDKREHCYHLLCLLEFVQGDRTPIDPLTRHKYTSGDIEKILNLGLEYKFIERVDAGYTRIYEGRNRRDMIYRLLSSDSDSDSDRDHDRDHDSDLETDLDVDSEWGSDIINERRMYLRRRPDNSDSDRDSDSDPDLDSEHGSS